ncbi:MAG: hypothetical protein WBQ72_18055, partial [Terriglobales bacterium]
MGAFTLEQILSSPFPTNLVAADHSGRIAWVFAAKGSRNVWIADAPNFDARQLTHYTGDDGMPIASLKLTPDGRTVVYARGSEVNRSGEVANPTSTVEKPLQQVWAADVDHAAPRLLGELGCDSEGCEDIQISPNGKFALWAAKKQIWIASISGDEIPRPSKEVFDKAVPANAPAKESAAANARPLTSARGDNSEPRWSPDSKKIAFVSDRGDHSFIVLYDFAAQSLHYLSPTADRDLAPRWSPDGSQLAFVRLGGKRMKQPLIPQTPLPWSIWVYDLAKDSAREIWHSGPALDDSLPELTSEASFQFAAKNR